jgi:oligopeptide transport system substrate-binding protein
MINTENFPLDHPKLRKALSLSIDRTELTTHLFFGEVPTLSLLPKTLSYCEDSEFSPEDPVQLFEQALEEMHLTREQFPKIIFSYAELSGQKKFAEFLKEQWKRKLGIDLEIACSEWNVHIANLRKGNYQIGTLHLTTLYQDPMFYFDLFRDKKSLCNYTRWENPQFRSLLEASERTTDNTIRTLLLKEAEFYLYQEMPAIALFTQNFQYLVRDNIDIKLSDLGLYDLKCLNVR